jgi:Tol biopolymer transport system component
MSVHGPGSSTRVIRLTVAAAVALVMLNGLSPAAAHPSSRHDQHPRHDQQPRIAFSRLDEALGGFALWTAAADGTDQQQLTESPAYFPSWAPDRTHLLFDFPDENGDEQIGRIDADGSNFRQLTDLAGVSEVADYSPSGESIVFDRFVPDPNGGDRPFFTSIWVMDADGGDPHPLFGPRSTTFDVEPDYSPDGSKIAFSRIRSDPITQEETYALFVAAADGSWQRRITPFGAGVEHPHWSPDGRWVLFDVESPENPRNGVYLVRPDGDGLHRILRSDETFIFFKPDYSPDGRHLLLGCYVVAEKQEDICMMDLHGRRLTRVVRTPRTFENFPVWSS